MAREERGSTTQIRICSWLETFLLLLGNYHEGPEGADVWASAQMQVVLEEEEKLCARKKIWSK